MEQEKRIMMDLKFGKMPDYRTHSPANVAWNAYNKKERWASDYVVDKYGKNHAWSVVSGKWNKDNGIDFVLLVEQNNTREVHASYEDVCKEFYWKSFKFNENRSSVFPNPMTSEEIDALFAERIAKTKVKDRKTLKALEAQKSDEEKKA